MTESTPKAQPTTDAEIEIRTVVQKIANIADIPLTPKGLDRGVEFIKEAIADGRLAQNVRARAQNPAFFNQLLDTLDESSMNIVKRVGDGA